MQSGHANCQNILVIDQGTHSSRALLLNQDGNVIASASSAITIQYPLIGFSEQSPLDILCSIYTSFDKLVSNHKFELIDRGTLIVQRSSILACRKDTMEAITPVISWQDTRNKKMIDNLAADQYQFIKEITGLRANAHYGASKIRWLLDNDPEVQKHYTNNNVLFVPLAAYLAFHLTVSHECVVDPVIASRTLLTGLGELQWHPELLQLFGIDEPCLPRIVPTQYHFGHINIGGRFIPLDMVGGDQSFIPFAEGLPVDSNVAYVNVGTGAFVQMPVKEIPDINGMLYSPLAISTNEKILVLEGTVNAAATALDWLWNAEGAQLDVTVINNALADEHNPPLFMNTIAGTGSPFWLPAQAPRFTREGSLTEKALAVLESIVFALMDNIQVMHNTNPALASIIIGGGLSQFDGFCQKLANLSGLEVSRPTIYEVSARGAAMYLLRKPKACVEGARFIPADDKPLLDRYRQYQGAIIQDIQSTLNL